MYRRGRKRSRIEFDLEDLDELDARPQKRSKTMEPQITLDSEGFNFGLYKLLWILYVNPFWPVHLSILII